MSVVSFAEQRLIRYALTYAATRTITNTSEKSAGRGKMKNQAMMPLANVASARAAMIGLAFIRPTITSSCREASIGSSSSPGWLIVNRFSGKSA